MQFDLDKELLSYFTDFEHLRIAFKNSVAVPTLTKRLLIIHGIGGVGKTSLLKMFRLHCKSVNIPVALASGDEVKSTIDVLTYWMKDLKMDGVTFPLFDKTFEHYCSIVAAVDEQTTKAKDAHGRIVDKAVSKTAEVTGSAFVGAMIGSFIPGIGSVIGSVLGNIFGGMCAEALVDWLRAQGFAKHDIDLLLDPTKRFTDDFLTDIDKIATTHRIVLILDTFEKMLAFEDWICNLARRLHPNLFLVIAGRGVPNWDRCWEGWLAQADVEELELMTPSVMHQLVRRYYRTLTDSKLDISQAEGIIQFARGLPIAITCAVDLMVKYHAKNFQAITPKVINDLAKRLQEGVPDDLKPALQAAAMLRWFDEPTLRAVMQKSDVSADYDRLKDFPFVVLHGEHNALHDVVREKLDLNFRASDSERYHDSHDRAAIYFEKQMGKAKGEEAWSLELERLYHRICADEGEGIQLFQETAEKLVQYSLYNRLRSLLNDVNTYPLEKENSRSWRKYYYARLLRELGSIHLNEVEKIYDEIIRKTQEDSLLRAKTLLDWTGILDRDEYYIQPGGPTRLVSMLKECEKILPEDDWERYLLLMRKLITRRHVRFQEIYLALMEVINFCLSKNDFYALASTCQWVKGYSAMHGRWREFLEIEQRVASFLNVNANPMLKAKTFSDWQVARIWMGRYAEAERIIREVVDIQTIGAKQQEGINRDLLYAIAVQGKAREVIPLLKREHDKYYELGQTAIYELHWVLRLLGIAYLCDNDSVNAKKCLVKAVKIINELYDPYVVHEDAYFLGLCCLARHEWQEAQECFSKYLCFPFDDWHLYFKSGALVGLIRVHEALGREEEIPRLLVEAENLALQFEYNDHLASLRLMQAYLVRDGKLPECGSGCDDVLRYYQHALIYALRYNRFMLDEVLYGGNVATPLQPIIPYLLEHGDEGRRMLIALRDWWISGVNDIGTLRPDTISCISEGIPLLEAESQARESEPGNGSLQKFVVAQIEEALKNNRGG